MKKIIVTGEKLPPSHLVISPNNFSPEPYPGYTIMYSKFLFLYTFHKTLFQEFVNYEK